MLVQVRRAIRVRHYSRRTEEAYVQWIRRFVRFHGLKHPVELGEAEVARFLSHLAEEGAVAAATQNQAASALQFLYQEVLRRPFARPERVVRARESVRLPVVLTPAEVKAVLAQLRGVPRLVASLLYGSGLRLLEALELRVKDVDFARREIVVRQGKGRKDRVTMLPVSVRELADEHLRRVQRLHRDDLARGLGAGAGAVELPDAFGVKVPSASRAWVWQWVFPAARLHRDAASGELRRGHLHDTVVQRAERAVTRFATRSPRIYWRPATTSARCRSCWATGTCGRR